ncbi:MAG: hypothetical protein WAN05_32595 [Roseiarcus sp.]|jgi:hypothetical protein
MNVNASGSAYSSSDYEAQANRLRAEMGLTIDELRSSLTPSNLAAEAASGVGLADLSWSGAFDFAGKRHPVPTAIIGLGLALWTLSAVRGRARSKTLADLGSPLTESSSSLVDSATKVLRDRAEAKRLEFIGTAQAQVASGAERLSDEIEKRVENIIVGVPGGSQARPLIASAIQIGLAALLETLLHRRSR